MTRIRQTMFGIGWGGLAVLTVSACQLLIMAVFARLLEPEHFGLMAIANIGLRFLSYFSQLGVGPAVVQKQNLERGDIGAAIAVSFGISCICACLAVLAAPLLSWFFVMNGLVEVTRVMAVTFLLAGLTAVPMGLLRRGLRFREIALIDTCSYVVGYGGVGLLTAYFGGGVWALVAATIGQGLLSAVFSLFVAREQLVVRHSAKQRRHFLAFGGQYSLIGFIEFVSANLDAMIVGKLMGQSATGVYSRATMLANLPVQQPVNVLTKTLFPLLSASVGRPDLLSAAYQAAVLLVGAFAFCVGFGVSATAEDIVRCVLGVKWVAAAQPLQVLALAVGPMFVSHVAGVALDSMGLLKVKLAIQASFLALLVLLMVVAARYGMTGVATALLINEFARMLVITFVVNRATHGDGRQLARVALVLAAFALLPSAAVLTVSSSVLTDLSPWPRLLAQLFVGVLSAALVLLLVRGLLGRISSVRLLVDRLPRFAKLLPASS